MFRTVFCPYINNGSNSDTRSNDVINEDIINFDNLDENGGFIKDKENVIDNSDNVVENKSNDNGNGINSESVSGSSGDSLCRSGNYQRRRFPKCVTKALAYLNDYDIGTGEDIVNFLDYCCLSNILENCEDVIQNDDSPKMEISNG